MKVALDVGHHYAASSGVRVAGLCERTICRLVAGEVGRKGVPGVDIVDYRTDVRPLVRRPPPYTRAADVAQMRARLRSINQGRPDAVVSLHLNGSEDPDARDYGLVVHHPASIEGIRLAECLARGIQACGLGSDVLVRPDEWLGSTRAMVRRTSMPTVIVEPFFLTSVHRQKVLRMRYFQTIAQYASAVMAGIGTFASEV